MSLQDNDAEFCTKLTLDDFEVVRCDKDGLIYKTDEVSIEREVYIRAYDIASSLIYFNSICSFNLVQFNM